MLAALFHVALVAVLLIVMAIGGIVGGAAAYAGLIYKGRTRAALLVNGICWTVAAIGLLVFALSAALVIPLVLR